MLVGIWPRTIQVNASFDSDALRSEWHFKNVKIVLTLLQILVDFLGRGMSMVKQLIFATRVPRHVQPVRRPCGIWIVGCIML